MVTNAVLPRYLLRQIARQVRELMECGSQTFHLPDDEAEERTA